MMSEMASFEGVKNEPSVGIFWFLPEEGDLFDVSAVPVSSLKKGLNTIPKLHKNVWAKNFYKAKAKGLTDSIYFKDYTQIPRGRVWYDRTANTFKVTVGSWYEKYEDILTPLLMIEFNLTEFKYEVDSHWELGHGWSEHDFAVYTDSNEPLTP